MKNLAVTSVVVLGCFFSLPNPVYAVNYGGTYTGDAIVSPGTECAASSYYLEMKVKGNRFETLVTRRGGREPNSQFRISGNIDSSGNLKPDVVGGYGSNLFFFGKIGSQNITGSSGGTGDKSNCVWTYRLTKKESEETVKIRVWFNSFIPMDIVDMFPPNIPIPKTGVSDLVPYFSREQIQILKKSIPLPPTFNFSLADLVDLRCAAGNGREFSNRVQDGLNSKTHQFIEFEVSIKNNKIVNVKPIRNPVRNIGVTHLVHCNNNKLTTILKSGQGLKKDINLPNPRIASARTIGLNFQGKISMPLNSAAPPIDFKADLQINPIDKTWIITGGHDGFPAYEAYIQIDNGAVQSMFKFDPRPIKNSVWNLFGGATYPIKGNGGF
ncbi:MAG: DUF3238 domain-containing protein [Aphanizomenon sp.]|jgi:hypothetical protein